MAEKRHVAVVLELQSNYRRHTEIYAGAQMFAKERGWKLTIDEFADHTLASSSSKGVPYDGIIARATSKLAEQTKRRNVPLVNVWLNSPVKDQLPGVFPDFDMIGRLMAEHFQSRGLCRFAALRCNTASHDLEWKSFSETIHKAGFPCSSTKVPLVPTKSLAFWEKTKHILAEAIERWQFPIGVWVGHELIGRLLTQECGNLGIRIPEDIAIISGSNELTFCTPSPSMTSMELGINRIGYESAQLLQKVMDEQEAKPRRRTAQKAQKPEHLILPPEGLVLRASTDFFAVEDELVGAALEFIASQSHLSIGVEDVARAVATEPRTLQRHFRKHLKRPIATEIRRVRLERAKRELIQSDRSIAEIARAVGFGESMRMNEVFRRELGVTPTEYRKERQIERV